MINDRTNHRGVTLVEVLIALVILLIVFMGLIQASLLSIDTNANNILRDEAVRLANDTISAVHASPFDDLDRSEVPPGVPDAGNLTFVISSTGAPIEQQNATNLGINTQKTMRNILSANYVVTVTVNDLDGDNKQVTVLVSWDYKERTVASGNPYTHQAVSLRRRT